MRRRDAKRLSRRLFGPRPPRPKPAPPDPLPRIEALTRNARNTWFVLLGVLVFVTITLMGVEHIDFWGVNRATELPLVGVSVPTWLFFYAAPILTAAVYCYFHLYLIRVFDAVFAAKQDPREPPLGDRIALPWLVLDAALFWRNAKRGDRSATPRILDGAALLLNFILIWGFGIGVLCLTWLLSTPARDPMMTFTALVMVVIAFTVGLASFAEATIKVGPPPPGEEGRLYRSRHQEWYWRHIHFRVRPRFGFERPMDQRLFKLAGGPVPSG